MNIEYAQQTMRFLTCSLLLGLLAPVVLGAQTVRGRVVLPDRTSPLVGATLTLVDSTGTAVARGVSGPAGRFVLPAAGTGPHSLRAVRIGYTATEVPVGVLIRGQDHQVEIVMAEQPLELAEIMVTTQNRCRIGDRDRERLAATLLRAQTALRMQPRSDPGSVQARALILGGTEDGPLHLPGGSVFYNSNNRYPEIDSLQAREVIGPSFLPLTPTELLLARGFAGYDSAGTLVLDVPHPDAILSDRFLAQYCFRIESRREGAETWQGLRFQPVAVVDSLTDIRGVLWLDDDTMWPRRLEFEYTHLPVIPVSSCVSRNRPAGYRAGERRYGPFCMRPRGRGAGSGGEISYAAAPQIGWFAVDWTLRTPGEEYFDRYLGYGLRPGPGRTLERCHDRPPRCARVYHAVPRLLLTIGQVIAITDESRELFHSLTAEENLRRITTLQAQPTGGAVSGTVMDMDGRPVRGAVIRTDTPTRAAISDETGRFELLSLPTRELTFAVSRPGYQPLAFQLPILADSTRRVTVTLVPVLSRLPLD